MHIRINKIDFLIFIIVICTIEISYFTYISNVIHWGYLLCQAGIISWGIADTIINKRFRFADLLIVIFIGYQICMTFTNGEGLRELLLKTETLLILYVSFKNGYNLKPQLYVKLMARYLLLITVVNTITALVCYPFGLFYYDKFTPAFFMGGDNTSTRIYILATTFCFINSAISKISNSKFDKEIILSIISLLNFLIFAWMRDIGNGKICSVVLVVGFVLFYVVKVPMIKVPMCKIIVFNYVLFFLMVIFNKLNLFSIIIVNILHKDLTLTTRTTIWSITIDRIIEHIPFGNGYRSGTQFEQMLPNIIGVNAHNTILMIAFVGGITLSIIFALILISSTWEYDRAIAENKICMLPIAFMAMFLRSQVEGGDAAFLIGFVMLISSVTKTIVDNETKTICM